MTAFFVDDTRNLFLIKYSKSEIVRHVEVSTRNQQLLASGTETECWKLSRILTSPDIPKIDVLNKIVLRALRPPLLL